MNIRVTVLPFRNYVCRINSRSKGMNIVQQLWQLPAKLSKGLCTEYDHFMCFVRLGKVGILMLFLFPFLC